MTEVGIENILDECIEAVIGRGEDIDAVCSRFPAHETELRQLVGIALMSSDALAVQVPAGAVDATRAKVMEGVRQAAARRELERAAVAGASSRRRFGLKQLAWISAVFVLLASGTALAASGAEPDNILYPLEQRMEEARTALAWQALDRAKSEAGHAEERLDEIEAMVAEGKRDLVEDLLHRYELHLGKAIDYASEAAAEGEDADEVFARIDAIKERHAKLIEELFGDEEGRQQISGSSGGTIGINRGSGGAPATPAPGDSDSSGDYDDDDGYYEGDSDSEGGYAPVPGGDYDDDYHDDGDAQSAYDHDGGYEEPHDTDFEEAAEHREEPREEAPDGH